MEKGETLVRVVKSFTKNLGNYESARIELGMERIVEASKIEFTKQQLSAEIEEFINSEITDLVSDNAH